MEIPEVNFRTQIAEELSRTELIDRLCEYHEKLQLVKIEAYNEAIDDAAKNANTKNVECGALAVYIEVDKESILKLKKSIVSTD